MSVLNIFRWPESDELRKADADSRAEQRAADEQRQRRLEGERAALREPGETMGNYMTAADEKSAGDNQKDYLAGVRAKADDMLDRTTGLKCAAAMKRAGISTDAFGFDVRTMRNVRWYESELKNYPTKLAERIKTRDELKAKVDRLEADLKAAKTEHVIACQKAQELEQTAAAYSLLRRKHLRLFGSPTEWADGETMRRHYGELGFPV